jgi:hypothetical protein
MNSEDWPFPYWFAPVMVILFGGVVLGMSLLSGSRNLNTPQVTGCYITPNGPDILVDQRTLHVHQVRPLNVPYKLEYIKGWSLTLDRWLDFRRLSDGSIEVIPGPDFGEFLFLSHEGVVADPKAGFDIVNHGDGVFVHYTPAGKGCGS